MNNPSIIWAYLPFTFVCIITDTIIIYNYTLNRNIFKSNIWIYTSNWITWCDVNICNRFVSSCYWFNGWVRYSTRILSFNFNKIWVRYNSSWSTTRGCFKIVRIWTRRWMGVYSTWQSSIGCNRILGTWWIDRSSSNWE